MGNGWRFDITQRGVQNFNPACLIVQSRDGPGLFNVNHFQGKSASKTTARFFLKINVLKFNLSF